MNGNIIAEGIADSHAQYSMFSFWRGNLNPIPVPGVYIVTATSIVEGCHCSPKLVVLTNSDPTVAVNLWVFRNFSNSQSQSNPQSSEGSQQQSV